MIENFEGMRRVTCDRCGATESATKSISNELFHSRGWVIHTNATKYIHMCTKCKHKTKIK